MTQLGAAIPSRRAADEPLLIDQLVPSFDVRVFNHAVVDVTVECAYESVRQLDLLEVASNSRWIRLLFALRAVPEALVNRARGVEPPPMPDALPLAGEGEGIPGWGLLDELPGRELVVGAIGRFWTPQIEWLEVSPADFTAFAEPGFGKIAWSFSVCPYGASRSLVTNECRVKATDPLSRRRFLRYWRLVGPFAGYVMSQSLPVIKSHAEAGAAAPKRTA